MEKTDKAEIVGTCGCAKGGCRFGFGLSTQRAKKTGTVSGPKGTQSKVEQPRQCWLIKQPIYSQIPVLLVLNTRHGQPRRFSKRAHRSR